MWLDACANDELLPLRMSLSAKRGCTHTHCFQAKMCVDDTHCLYACYVLVRCVGVLAAGVSVYWRVLCTCMNCRRREDQGKLTFCRGGRTLVG